MFYFVFASKSYIIKVLGVRCMRIVICDDERAQIDILKHYIEEYDATIDIVIYDNAENLWWDIEDSKVADIYLLDIQMSKMNGMELAKKMRASNIYAPIAFISGISDYVFEGYEVNAMGYILKPYEKSQIFKLLDKMCASVLKEANYVIVENERVSHKLYIDDIIGLEAMGHDTCITCKKSKYTNYEELVLHKGINEVMDLIKGESFVKIHRSFVVNMRNINKIGKSACIGENNKEYPIARGNYEMCMKEFIRINRG